MSLTQQKPTYHNGELAFCIGRYLFVLGAAVVSGYFGGDGSLRYFGGLDKIGALCRLILGFYVVV